MATITSAQSGDFSSSATWVGGVVPTVGDIAVAANGHVVAIDTDVTVTRVTQLGTGKFTLGGGRTLTADVEAVSGSFTSGGTVEVTATSGSTAYIIGNVTGLSTTVANIAGVVVTGTGKLIITGNITASTGDPGSFANGSAGVYTNVGCQIEITGNLQSSSGRGKNAVRLDSNANAILNITGNVVGLNSFSDGAAVASLGASDQITVIGTVTGGSGTTNHGVLITGISALLNITGNLQGGTSTSRAITCTGQFASIIVTGNISTNTATGIDFSGTSATITITGNIIGGGTTNAHAINTTGTSPVITVTGNVTGGGGTTAYGISATGASATINVVGNVSGGGGPGTAAHGIYATGASSIIDINGTLTGTNNSSAGVRSDATTGYVIFGGNLIDSPAGATALYAIRARIRSTGLSGYNQYSTTDGFTTGSQVQRVSTDIVTGMPANRDVRLSTLYGYNNELTGTMIVPPTSSVLTGVLVDNSAGSLVFDTKEQIADAVLHLLAGITETGSVVTIPFYSGSKDYSRTTIVDGTRTKTFTPIEE
jgi:hypothetical protein